MLLNRLPDRSEIVTYLSRPLHEGKPELGWAGDPDLHLIWHRLGWWEIWRFEPTAEDHERYVPVLRGRPGVQLSEETVNGAIAELVSRDTHRVQRDAPDHVSAVEEAIAHNERLDAQHTQAAADATTEALEKLYWGIGREVGHHY